MKIISMSSLKTMSNVFFIIGSTLYWGPITANANDALDNWTYSHICTNDLYGVACGNGQLIAVGRQAILARSTNGIDWMLTPMGFSHHFAAAFGGGRFLVTGYSCEIYFSSDAEHWTGGFISGHYFYPWTVRYCNGLNLMGGVGGNIIASADMLSWTNVANGYGDIQDIACSKDKFVAVGIGQILTSTNATNWTRQLQTGAYYYGVEYGKGVFVAVGAFGSMYVSSDAETWTYVNSFAPSHLTRVCYAQGVFVAVGNEGGIVTSTDGTNWVSRHSGVSFDLRGISYWNGRFIAVGENGTILQSDRFGNLSLSRGTVRELKIQGIPGQVCQIESTGALEANNWTNRGTMTLTNSLTIWPESDTNNHSQQFYRAVFF